MDRDPTPSPDHEPAPEAFEAFDARLPLTPEQQLRVVLMRHIAQHITAATGDNFVLKGGTALLLAYGLPRYSTDLDFDGQRREPDRRGGIEQGIQSAGVRVRSLALKKNTATTRRYMLHYEG